MRHPIASLLSSKQRETGSDNDALGALCYKEQAPLTLQSVSLGQDRACESVNA